MIGRFAGLGRLVARRDGRFADAERGQVLVLFSLVAAALIGSVAIVTDVSWLWVNQQRLQRAADAAALAGSVYLPGDPSTAYTTAYAEAAKNGYRNGIGGIVVTPQRDPVNPRRLTVRITAPVGTYFARVFCVGENACLETVTVGARATAEYTLPVPMGSPQSYYGVGYLVAPVTTTTTTDTAGTTPFALPATTVAGGTFTSGGNARAADGVYATASVSGNSSAWTGFPLLTGTTPPPDSPSTAIAGIEVRLVGTSLTGSGTATACVVRVEISGDNGASWSLPVNTAALGTTLANRTAGSTTSTSIWGGRTWTRADLSSSTFRVRLTWIEGVTGCAATQAMRLDAVDVRVAWTSQQTTTTTTWQQTAVQAPDGTTLTPQNFWGAMQSQGSPVAQGDAYLTRYDTRATTLNAAYSPNDYYNYAVEVPAGATNGEVWIFDPGFCDTRRNYGLGEAWTIGGTNGAASPAAMSSYYDIYDTRETPYDTADDLLVATSGSTFQRMAHHDARSYAVPGDTATPPAASTDCSSATWHLGWWRLASGLSGGEKGRTYRVHTYSTEKANPTAQNNTTAMNAFAIWTRATGGSPKVYGIGSMETLVRLPPSTTSEFYLARIDRVHAGKTLQIELWDPGDTGQMSGTLQILRPTATTYSPVTISWTAKKGSTASGTSSCTGAGAANVSSVATNSGGTSHFNGCWLTIQVTIPADYTAPLPGSDTITTEGGWWKIRYSMGAAPTGTDYATDVATWQVSVRGSPVHLVP